MRYLALIIMVILAFTACSTGASYESRTGFLQKYDGLKRVSVENVHYFEKVDDANLSSYDKIFVPDIKVFSNTAVQTSSEHGLYTQITAYATAAYRKNIMKSSANYTLVDVAQKGTIMMEIAISVVEVHPGEKGWDSLSAFPLSLNESTQKTYEKGNVRLLIEARITDVMSKKLLARSMRVIMEEEVRVETDKLLFKDLQASLDRWLYEAAIRY